MRNYSHHGENNRMPKSGFVYPETIIVMAILYNGPPLLLT